MHADRSITTAGRKHNPSDSTLATISMMNKKCSGVSLIELTIGLAILGILVGFGVPFFQNFIISNRLTSQANELLAAYQVARAEAIRLNGPVRLCRTANATSVTCAGGGRANWTAWIVIRPDNSEVLQRGVVRPNLTVLSSPAITNDIVVFRSDSLPRTEAGAALIGTLQVCAAVASPAENARRMRISLSRALIETASVGAGGCAAAPGDAT